MEPSTSGRRLRRHRRTPRNWTTPTASTTRPRSTSAEPSTSTPVRAHNRPAEASERGRSMAEPLLSEIRIMSFNFPPKGWAQCDGQLLPINQNQGLFSLLGTTYGGDGRVNFALPDLRGRVPIHMGQ